MKEESTVNESNDPLDAWREALAQGQQTFLSFLSNQAAGKPAPQFAEWWTKFGAPKSAPGPDAAGMYLAACDHFFALTRAFMEQLPAQPSAKDLDPQSIAKNFAAGLEAWFQKSGAPGKTAWTQGLELPSLGLTRQQQELWQRILELTKRYQELQAALATQWSAVGREAAQKFGAELAAAQQAGKGFADLKSLYDRWIDNAEKAYSTQAHQESYARVLADLTNTLNEIKGKQREMIEGWAQQFDLPTRTELNTVHSRIKAMQRQLHELSEKPAAKAAAKAAARPKRAPRKKRKP
jgi:class III poly(R)-hydroxyalkanoic acid synthase PhaE subunit